MLDLSWKVFEMTGNVETFLEYRRLKELKCGYERDEGAGHHSEGSKGWGGQ